MRKQVIGCQYKLVSVCALDWPRVGVAVPMQRGQSVRRQLDFLSVFVRPAIHTRLNEKLPALFGHSQDFGHAPIVSVLSYVQPVSAFEVIDKQVAFPIVGIVPGFAPCLGFVLSLTH